MFNLPMIITKKTLGNRTFEVAAPNLWNSLPATLRNIDNLQEFKCHLKAHLFKQAFYNWY